MSISQRKLKQIKKVARKIRQRLEFLNPDNPLLVSQCRRAASWLLTELRRVDYTPHTVQGAIIQDAHGFKLNEIHWWVECCGKVIDITATQFGYRNKVKIFDVKKKLANGYLNI